MEGLAEMLLELLMWRGVGGRGRGLLVEANRLDAVILKIEALWEVELIRQQSLVQVVHQWQLD